MKRTALLALAFAVLTVPACAADLNKRIPAPALDPASAAQSETLVLAGGCFWGQQGVFQHVKGVSKVVAGYSGGTKATATYEMVTTETTGHAEAVQITFDPKVISAGKLLQIYFSVAHDPTELNRQGPDSGPSYRSEIYFASDAQEKTARAYVAQLAAAKIFAQPIVTKIERVQGFYPAEGYHQDFLAKNPNHGYIVMFDLPKLAALKAVWPEYYRDTPVLLTQR